MPFGQVLKGYSSFSHSPGQIFQCQIVDLCPGGPPGSCAEGRDNSTVGCNECASGLRDQGQGAGWFGG